MSSASLGESSASPITEPLFQFRLRPLDQITPWGAPEDPNLHWFALTDGEYWIQAGEHTLFEYSAAAQARTGIPRFCDYQIVRLYEDVTDLAPYALEPVPEELQRFISVNESKPWNHYWTKWCRLMDPHTESDEAMSLLDAAGVWMGKRTLDSLYLNPSTNIVLWSDQEYVHVQWDNRDQRLADCPAWSASFGCWQLPRTKFIEEVHSFHDRLMEQMALRISQIAAGALAKGIRVDLDGLHREQQRRTQSIEQMLALHAPTHWPAVMSAVQSLENL